MDVHLPSSGWSPNIKNMVTNLPKDGHPFFKGWPPTIPRMVRHHLKDGHPPSKGVVTHHPQDGHPSAVKWSTTIPIMVISLPKTVKSRPGNNSQLSFSLARLPQNFCEKMRNLKGKMQNWKKKRIKIDFSHGNSKKLMEK